MIDNEISLKQCDVALVAGILKAQNYILMFLNSPALYTFFLPESILSKQVMPSIWSNH